MGSSSFAVNTFAYLPLFPHLPHPTTRTLTFLRAAATPPALHFTPLPATCLRTATPPFCLYHRACLTYLLASPFPLFFPFLPPPLRCYTPPHCHHHASSLPTLCGWFGCAGSPPLPFYPHDAGALAPPPLGLLYALLLPP